ncbi:MAG: hypothetical protein GY754_26020 [bacterium]|nr:hypothetical protein [bacterium]
MKKKTLKQKKFRTAAVFLMLLLAVQACGKKTFTVPAAIPQGEWNYILLLNGNQVGTALLSNSIDSNNNYISTLKMEMKAGSVINTTRSTVTETRDFKPVKFELYNKTINNKSIDSINTIAQFKGNTVELDMDNNKSTITIKQPFHLEGNFYFSQLIEKKFKKGTVIRSLIYDPTMELNEPVPMTVEVKGIKNITVERKNRQLMHIVLSIVNIKTMDIYLNEMGVTEKVNITMLNNVIEIVKK